MQILGESVAVGGEYYPIEPIWFVRFLVATVIAGIVSKRLSASFAVHSVSFDIIPDCLCIYTTFEGHHMSYKFVQGKKFY
jgi:hypothetical protein